MLICLCGKSGSGKSTIAKLLSSYNDKIISLNIDEIGHDALADPQIKMELVNSFGKNILNDTLINRKKLGELVFTSRNNMQILTNLTWSYMEKKIDEEIINNPNKIIILDWLLLPKTKYFKEADLRILVEVPYAERLRRAMLRDNITEEKFKERENASIEYNPNDFDYVINNLEQEKTKEMVKSLYDKSIVSR